MSTATRLPLALGINKISPADTGLPVLDLILLLDTPLTNQFNSPAFEIELAVLEASVTKIFSLSANLSSTASIAEFDSPCGERRRA